MIRHLAKCLPQAVTRALLLGAKLDGRTSGRAALHVSISHGCALTLSLLPAACAVGILWFAHQWALTTICKASGQSLGTSLPHRSPQPKGHPTSGSSSQQAVSMLAMPLTSLIAFDVVSQLMRSIAP
eukprot:5637874-Amphidinium_carterae.1